MNGAADEKSPGTVDLDQLEPLGRLDETELGPPARHARPPRRASARCGRASASARRPSSSRRRSARRGGSPTSPARSRPAACSRCRSASALDDERRQPSVVSTRRPSARAARRSGPSAARASDSSPVSSKRPSWPARMPGRSRMSVPALPQSIGRPGSQPAQADAVDDELVVVPRPRPRRRAPAPPSTVASVSPRAAEAADARLALADRADQDGAVGDRLVARERRMPDDRAGRRDLSFRSSTGETTTP